MHPSQSADVQKPAVLEERSPRACPREIPVALGSIERGDGFGAGSYITWHAPRESGREGWGHVLALARGRRAARRWKKPVVSDEPIGAGAEVQPGRRDDAPARFRAAALLTRLAGLGATFHYEAGLQARVPEGRELECFNAWNEAWTLLPARRRSSTVRSGAAAPQAASSRRSIANESLAIYERADEQRAGGCSSLGMRRRRVTLAGGWTIVDEPSNRRVAGCLRVTRSTG